MKTLTKLSLLALTSISLNIELQTSNCFAQVANGTGAGNCLSYDGVSNYVSVPDNNSWYFGANDFSVETWIKIQGGTAAGIYSQGDGYSAFAIVLSKSSGIWKLLFGASSAGVAWDVSSGYVNTSMVEGVWYHIAVVRSGSTWKSYVNGVNIASITSSVATFDSNQDPYIGLYHGSAPDYRYFNGSIDEVRIYNHALTQDEIRVTMCQKLKGNETGLVGYWRFDEGSGSTAYDSSPNGNNGTLH